MNRKPVWQPSRLSQIKTFLGDVLEKITFVRVALAVLLLPLILYVYREVTRDALIIDPFSVPKSFQDAGLTSDVLANRIGDRLRQIESATQTRMKKDNLGSFQDEAAIPEVEIPGTKLGLKTVIDITRSVFGIYPKHVSGDVVLSVRGSTNVTSPATVKLQATVMIYVSHGWNRRSSANVTDGAEDLAMLVQHTAETVLGQVNPYVLALYRYNHGQHEKAIAIIQAMIGNPPEFRGQKEAALQKQAALLLWGLALYQQEKYDEAIIQFQNAIELDPKYAYAYNNLGSALNDQKKYDEAIAKFEKALELDPKDAAAYHNWALALEAEGKAGEAVKKFKKADELSSSKQKH